MRLKDYQHKDLKTNMAHKEQREFFNTVKEKYPHYFNGVRVLDCGSLDVNGSLKELFTKSKYTGIDIVDGKNVDVVCKAHEYKDKPFEVVVSAEMLEHDEFYRESLQNMYKLLESGGLLVISAAGKGRPPHGTSTTGRGDIWGTSEDYYRNIVTQDFKDIYDLERDFSDFQIEYEPNHKDIYFYGIKK